MNDVTLPEALAIFPSLNSLANTLNAEQQNSSSSRIVLWPSFGSACVLINIVTWPKIKRLLSRVFHSSDLRRWPM